MLETKPVDVDVVGPEPVAEAAVCDADGSEHLTSGADRGRQRLLHVLEQDLPAGDRRPVQLFRQACEADTGGRATPAGSEQVEKAPVAAGDEVDVLRRRRDGRAVGCDERGRDGGRGELLEQRS